MDTTALQEWLAKAKEDPKVAAQPVVVVLIAIALLYKFMYFPQKTALAKQTKANKSAANQINGLKSAVDNLDELKIEVADLLKAREAAIKVCYPKAEAPIFLQDLRAIARRCGLTLRSLSPMPPQPRNFEHLNYEYYPIKISFEGNFRQLGKFLYTLESHPRLIAVPLPALKPDASGTFKFDLEPATVLIPPDFGQKQEAAPPPEE